MDTRKENRLILISSAQLKLLIIYTKCWFPDRNTHSIP